jgi:hypothetical protein
VADRCTVCVSDAPIKGHSPGFIYMRFRDTKFLPGSDTSYKRRCRLEGEGGNSDGHVIACLREWRASRRKIKSNWVSVASITEIGAF